MPYKFLEELSIADVAFEATGKTLEELLEASGLALLNIQVSEIKKVKQTEKREFLIEAENEEKLLHSFLEELIFIKDAYLLLLSKFKIKLIKKTKDGSQYEAHVEAYGEKLDMKKHEMLVDAKGVSWHLFSVEKKDSVWKAIVIIDV